MYLQGLRKTNFFTCSQPFLQHFPETVSHFDFHSVSTHKIYSLFLTIEN